MSRQEQTRVPDTPTDGRSAATGRLRGVSRRSGAEPWMPIAGVRGGCRAANGVGSVAEDPRTATGALSATAGGAP